MTPGTTEPVSRTEGKPSLIPEAVTEKRFDWPICYEAENFVLDQIQAFLARNSVASTLSERMRSATGTLLIDWVDYLVLPPKAEAALRRVGFTDDPRVETPAGQKPLWHPDAMLPLRAWAAHRHRKQDRAPAAQRGRTCGRTSTPHGRVPARRRAHPPRGSRDGCAPPARGCIARTGPFPGHRSADSAYGN